MKIVKIIITFMELNPSNDEVSKGNNNWFNKDIQLGILLIQL